MRIVVFGATGGLGRQILEQALAAEHQVTAVVRTPDGVALRDARLAVARGDVLDPESVRAAVAGHDAVVSAFGARPGTAPGRLYTQGTEHILDAMERGGVRRLVGVSTWLVGESRRRAGWWVRIAIPLLGKDLYRERERQEALIRASALDWIIVRPARLTNGPRTGRYRAGPRLKLRATSHIARADAAEFVVKQLTDDAYLRQAVGVSY